MSRADAFLAATAAAMEPLTVRHRWLWAHDGNVSGCGAAGIFADKNPTLHRPATASCSFPGLLPHPSSGLPVKMSLAFQVRNHHKLHRCSGSSIFYGGKDKDAIDKICREVKETVADTIRDVGNAIGPKKSDTLLLKRRGTVVRVPSGNLVSERAWAKLNGSRKLSFNPRIAVVLVPTRGECYPTSTDRAACFFSNEEREEETRHVSTTGVGNAEWLALLAETRAAAAEEREKRTQARLRTQKKEQQQEQAEEGGRRFNLFGALGGFWKNLFAVGNTNNNTTNSKNNGMKDNNGDDADVEGERLGESFPDDGVLPGRGAAGGSSSRRVGLKHSDPMSCSSLVSGGTKGQEAG